MRDWFLSDFLEGDAVALLIDNSKGPDWLVSSVTKTQQLLKDMFKILKMRNRYASQLQDLKCTAEDAAKNIVAEALLQKLPEETLEVRRNVASNWLKNELTGIDAKMKNLDDKATEYIGWGGRRVQSLLTYILDREPEVASQSFRQMFEYWSELNAADMAARRLRSKLAGPTAASTSEKENDVNQLNNSVEVQNKSPEPSAVVRNKSPEPRVVLQNKSPEPRVVVQNKSPEPSAVVQNKSPEPCVVDVQNKSPEPCVVDVQNKSPEPSVEVVQNKSPEPSVEVVQNKSPEPSVEVVQNKSPEPSVDKAPEPSVHEQNKSPEPRLVVQNKSQEPSVGEQNKSPEPSGDVQNKSPEPSEHEQNKSQEPSVDVQNKSPEPSVDVQNKSPEPCVDVQNKSPEPSAVVQNKSQEPSVDVQNKSPEPSAVVQNKSPEPSAVVQNKSQEPSVDVQNKPVATGEQQVDVQNKPVATGEQDTQLGDFHTVDDDMLDIELTQKLEKLGSGLTDPEPEDCCFNLLADLCWEKSQLMAEGYISQIDFHISPVQEKTDALDMKCVEGAKEEAQLKPLVDDLGKAIDNYGVAIKAIKTLYASWRNDCFQSKHVLMARVHGSM
ncbi:fhaB [Symbiodinium sp. CCMP2456]|nr:fhaB [Symbiodinium sp. CCMP2456]